MLCCGVRALVRSRSARTIAVSRRDERAIREEVEHAAGVQGRHRPHGRASRRRGGRSRCGRRRARRTSSTSCSTTSATGRSAASAACARRRTSTGSPRTACATATSTRRRSARRRARACSPDATTTRTRWRASSRTRAASPATPGEIPFENGFLSEMLTPHGYAAYAVGKWHLTPHHEMNMAAPRNRWPLGPRLRALLRVHGRRHEPVAAGPGARQPPDRAAADGRGGLPPHRGPGRPGDRVPHGPEERRADQAVLPLLRHRRLPRAAPRAARVDREVSRQVRHGLGAGARGRVRAAEGDGHRPAGHGHDAAAARGSRSGTRCRTTRSGSTRG